MRDIIFRGKRKDNGEWVTGDLWTNLTNPEKPIYRISTWDGDHINYEYTVIPETVGQFVRTSSLGEDIYEGDILEEDPHFKSRFEVVWDARYSKYKLDCTRVCDHIQYPEWNRGIKMRIIGNVIDNPELLTPSQKGDVSNTMNNNFDPATKPDELKEQATELESAAQDKAMEVDSEEGAEA